MIDLQDALNTVWEALASYREDCISEGQEAYDEEWDNICTAMAVIQEKVTA